MICWFNFSDCGRGQVLFGRLAWDGCLEVLFFVPSQGRMDLFCFVCLVSPKLRSGSGEVFNLGLFGLVAVPCLQVLDCPELRSLTVNSCKGRLWLGRETQSLKCTREI